MEAPVITCVGNQLINTDKGMDTAMVLWEGPKASDNSGNVSRIICNPQSGTSFSIEETTVTCEAVDRSGNKAECSFQVIVIGTFLCTLYCCLTDLCVFLWRVKLDLVIVVDSNCIYWHNV